MEYLKDPQSVKENNAVIYSDYYEKPSWWFRFRYDTQVKRKTILYLLRKAGFELINQSVLELGFGSGAVLFSFDKSCGIYGVEISESAIRLAELKAAKMGYKEYGFKYSNTEELKYPDEMFDLVIASHVIEHLEDDQQMIQEIFRVLKAGGAAVFLVPINERYKDPNHVKRYTPEKFLSVLRQSGFQGVSEKIENELLFYLVEKFYFEEYNQRWGTGGQIIAGIFNFPSSILPFSVYKLIDHLFMFFGFRPRQFGCVVKK